MARLLDGTADFLRTDTATPITAAPFTISAWFYPETDDRGETVACLAEAADASDKFSINARGNVVDDPLQFTCLSGGAGFNNATTVNSMSFGAWNHAIARAYATDSRDCVLNGDIANKGTNTTDDTPTGIDIFGVGATPDPGSPSDFLDGRVAEVGLWDVALSDPEVVALSKGVPPLRVRPGNLVGYWHCGLMPTSPEPDMSKNSNQMLVISGATVTDHAPVAPMFWFDGQAIEVAGVSAAPAGLVRIYAS